MQDWTIMCLIWRLGPTPSPTKSPTYTPVLLLKLVPSSAKSSSYHGSTIPSHHLVDLDFVDRPSSEVFREM